MHYGRKLLLIALVQSIFYLQQFLLLPVLSRNLGLESYGVWSQILVAVNFLLPVCLLSLPDAFIRFSAGSQNKREIGENYYTILASIVITGLIISALFYFSADFVRTNFIKTEAYILPIVRVASLLIFSQCLSQYSTVYFRAFQREKMFSALQLFQATGTIAVALLMTYCGHGLFHIILSVAIVHFVIFAISQIRILRDIDVVSPNFKLLKQFLKFSLPILPSAIMNWIINVSDRYFIGYFLPVTDVAIYSASYTLAMVISFIYAPFYVILTPKLTQLWENGDETTLRKVLYYSNKFPLLVSIPLLFGLMLMGANAIQILTGSPLASSTCSTLSIKYIPCAIHNLIPLISLGYILFYTGFYYAQVFILVKKTQHIFYGYLIASVVNIVLNRVLVPRIGIMGAGTATLLTFLAQMIYFTTVSRKYFDIQLSFKFVWYSLVASLVMFITLLSIYHLFASHLLGLCLLAIIGATTYVTLIYLLGVIKYNEIKLLKALIFR